jgi:hypothetical protein
LRKREKYTVAALLHEYRILREVILNDTHQNLLSLNLSELFTDLAVLSGTLDELVELSVSAFLTE